MNEVFYFDFLQIREISRDAGVYTDQELRAILKFYHSFGKITFFGENALFLNERLHNLILCCILGSRWFDICHLYFPGGQHGGSPVLRDTVIFSPAAFSQIVYRLTARIYSKKMVKNILTKPPLNTKIKPDLLF